MCAIQAFTGEDVELPSRAAIRRSQEAAVAGTGTSVDTHFGTAERGQDGVYCVTYKGCAALWVPPADAELQLRLMVCAHMKDAGHRGVEATLARLTRYCVWRDMETDVRGFVRQCLFCAESWAGELVPRSLASTVRGEKFGM